MKTENKVWPCEHILQNGNGDFFWSFGHPQFYVGSEMLSQWDTCPFKNCGARRPEEPEALWEVLKQRQIDGTKDDEAMTLTDWYFKLNAEESLRWVKKYLISSDLFNKRSNNKYAIQCWLEKQIERCK